MCVYSLSVHIFTIAHHPRCNMVPKKINAALTLLVQKAAELRAGGASWEMVATDVERAVATVRRWPAEYPVIWKRAFRIAERQLLTDATAESVLTLRKQLRSEDEKSSRDAAQKLIQFRMAKQKKPASKKPAKPPTIHHRIALYLETLSDEEIQTLTDEHLPKPVTPSQLDDAPQPEAGC